MGKYKVGAIVFGFFFICFFISFIFNFNTLKFPNAIPGIIMTLSCGCGMIVNIVKCVRQTTNTQQTFNIQQAQTDFEQAPYPTLANSQNTGAFSQQASTNQMQSVTIQQNFICPEKVLIILYHKVTVSYTEKIIKAAVYMYESNSEQIIKDCEKILNSTTDIDTFFSRLNLFDKRIGNCAELQKELPTFTHILPDTYYSELIYQKADLINDFIARSYAAEIEKAKELKTAYGRFNRIKKYFQSLKQHESEMLPQNLEYMSALDNYHLFISELNEPSSALESSMPQVQNLHNYFQQETFGISELEFDISELQLEFEEKHGAKSKKLCDEFENLERAAWEENDINKRIQLLQQAIDAYEKARQWHYNFSNGAKIYFQLYWEPQYSNPTSFSWIRHVKSALEFQLHKRDEIIPWILENAKHGFSQTEIYKAFPENGKSDLRRVIDELASQNLVTKTKKGSSYYITIQGDV